jgi:hypothetical protein
MRHAPARRRPHSGPAGCTELENEGWLLRLVLDFFRTRREIRAVLTFVDRCLASAPQGARAAMNPREREDNLDSGDG